MNLYNIKTVAVIGAGIMGQGIIQSYAQAGYKTWAIDIDSKILADSISQIEANLELFKKYDLLTEDIAAVMSRIKRASTDDLDEIKKEADFIIESVPEKLELKREVFNSLDSCNEGVILASNTGSFTIPLITEGMKTSDRVIGIHYFNPAHIIPLVELHWSQNTRQEIIDTTKAFIEKTGKNPIMVKKNIPGLVVNRIQAALGREAMHLIGEGVVSPEDVDIAAKTGFGFRWACIGTIESFDMMGLDTLLNVGKNIFPVLDNSDDQPKWFYDMVNKGNLGIKSGKGYYDYAGRTKSEILNELNNRLLPQLKLFKEKNTTK